MDVESKLYGYSFTAPSGWHLEALYACSTPEGDPSIDFGVGMAPGAPVNLEELTGAMLQSVRGENPWLFSCFVDAKRCPPLSPLEFVNRLRVTTVGRGEAFDGSRDPVLASLAAVEVAWHVGARHSTMQCLWHGGVRSGSGLSREVPRTWLAPELRFAAWAASPWISAVATCRPCRSSARRGRAHLPRSRLAMALSISPSRVSASIASWRVFS
jgi:hypothetical protein